MRPSVLLAFPGYSAKFEGVCTFMYLDVKCLVTTGIGDLIDPLALALSVHWTSPDGSTATQEEIATEWREVKARIDLAPRGGGIFASVTKLRLSSAGVADLLGRTAQAFDRDLAARFTDYAQWPADAQLAMLSLAWACGPEFHFPKMEAFMREGHFTSAADEVAMNEIGNPGIHPRNVADRLLLRNAARVVAGGLDPDVLYYPRDLSAEADTEPELPNPPSEEEAAESERECAAWVESGGLERLRRRE